MAIKYPVMLNNAGDGIEELQPGDYVEVSGIIVDEGLQTQGMTMMKFPNSYAGFGDATYINFSPKSGMPGGDKSGFSIMTRREPNGTDTFIFCQIETGGAPVNPFLEVTADGRITFTEMSPNHPLVINHDIKANGILTIGDYTTAGGANQSSFIDFKDTIVGTPDQRHVMFYLEYNDREIVFLAMDDAGVARFKPLRIDLKQNQTIAHKVKLIQDHNQNPRSNYGGILALSDFNSVDAYSTFEFACINNPATGNLADLFLRETAGAGGSGFDILHIPHSGEKITVARKLEANLGYMAIRTVPSLGIAVIDFITTTPDPNRYLMLGSNGAAGAGYGTVDNKPVVIFKGDHPVIAVSDGTVTEFINDGRVPKTPGTPAGLCAQFHIERLRHGRPPNIADGGGAAIFAHDADFNDAPVYAFFQDYTTGICHPYNNQIGFAVGGTLALNIDLATASFRPSVNLDGVITLGGPITRFRDLYVAAAPIVGSDRRLKSDIEDSALGLDFIKKLRPRQFKMLVGGVDEKKKDAIVTKKGKRVHQGLVYQEVEEALGKVDSAILVKDKDSGIGALRYEEIITPLIKAVQELCAEVTASKSEIATLKAEVALLRGGVDHA